MYYLENTGLILTETDHFKCSQISHIHHNIPLQNSNNYSFNTRSRLRTPLDFDQFISHSYELNQ